MHETSLAVYVITCHIVILQLLLVILLFLSFSLLKNLELIWSSLINVYTWFLHWFLSVFKMASEGLWKVSFIGFMIYWLLLQQYIDVLSEMRQLKVFALSKFTFVLVLFSYPIDCITSSSVMRNTRNTASIGYK